MPTIRRCCIVGCLSNSRQNPQLQFFQFPKPENPFHKLWKQACHASLSRILPFKKPVVCALHFQPNYIGGRRLTSTAVPSLRLEVPSNLKAVEQQAMMDEIERSRKCAYINAVVYEWLVRANLNPQLRGSITHGMIKEKADTAKQLIGSTNFIADNRWLNRFRESHLTGFAQKLASHQLKPLGPSLWIPDIVEDLQHLFPPTSADRVNNLENVPERYIDYMQQYGEYEEDDDQEQDQLFQEQKPGYGQQQQQNNYNNFYFENRNQQNSFGSPNQRPSSNSPSQQQSNSNRSSPYSNSAKRQKHDDDEEEENDEPQSTSGETQEQIEDLTDGPEVNFNNHNKTKTNGAATPNGHSAKSPTPRSTPTPTPTPVPTPTPTSTNSQTNGHVSPVNTSKEIDSYAQALEYLKPLEDFALFKENFRAIGLISQLEIVLRKGDQQQSESTDD